MEKVRSWSEYPKEEWELLSDKEKHQVMEDSLFHPEFRKAREEFESIIKEIIVFHDSKMPELTRLKDIMKTFNYGETYYSLAFVMGSAKWMDMNLRKGTTINEYFKANIKRYDRRQRYKKAKASL